MKRTKINMTDENQLITHMITSTEFLKKIYNSIDPKLFESKYAQIIARWVVEFFDRVGEAPGLAIQDIFQKKAQLVRDEDVREAIGDYLSHLGKQWEQSQIHNVEYSYQNGMEYLRIRNLHHLCDKIQASINRKDPGEGESEVAGFKRMERPVSTGFDLFHDAKVIKDAGEQTDEILFKMPGDLGIAMGPICRGDFVSVNAPMKRGKSWMLQECGFRASLNNLNVWMVSLEMTTKQTARRLWSGFTGKPLKSGKYRLPFFQDGEDGTYDIVYKNKRYEGWSTNMKEIEELQEQYMFNCGGSDFRVSIFPTDTLTLSELKDELENLEFYENFVPDVVIVDYADIMVGNRRKEKRFELDEIWKGLRGIATDRNIVVITASQTSKGTMNNDAGAGDVAEHFGKNSHVTKGIFLNQTDEEKENGILRVNCSINREGATVNSQVIVLQGLSIGRMYLDSKFRKKVNLPNRSGGKDGI